MAAHTAETTLYIVAYDIPNDRRRTKIHKLLCGYGQWTQFSLFECWLNKKQLIQLRHDLDEHIHRDEDNIRFYPLCSGCQKTVVTVGSVLPVDPPVFLL